MGILAGGATAAAAAIGLHAANEITKPGRPSPADDYVISPFETGADYEDIEFPARDGSHRIRGWWLSRPETDRVIVGCTGYRGHRWFLIGIGTILWRAGFNVLLFDYPGHGTDRGRRISLGYHELRDFLSAVDYATSRIPNARLGVLGYSMGASVAILGTAVRPEVRALIADSPFDSHADVVAHSVSNSLRLPIGSLIVPFVDYFLPLLAGYHHADVDPMRCVADIAPRPLLLIHGDADRAIPAEHSRRLFAAAGEPKELWIGHGADHCGTYFLDRAAYAERTISFFERHLGAARETAAHSQRRDQRESA
jgi:alpha-beta hydrolase superfamily lysophospholipase